MKDHLPALIVMVPLMVALVTLAVSVLSHRLSGFTALLGLVATVGLDAWAIQVACLEGIQRYAWGGWPSPWGVEFRVTATAGFVVLAIAFASLLVLLNSFGSLRFESQGARHERPSESSESCRMARRTGWFHTLLPVLTAGLSGAVISSDAFHLFLWLELSSLAIIGLSLLPGPPAVLAGLRLLLQQSLGSILLLLGLGFLYATTGSLDFGDLIGLLPFAGREKAVVAGLVFLAVGLMIKSCLFPWQGRWREAFVSSPASVNTVAALWVGGVPLWVLLRFTSSLADVRHPAVVFALALLACGAGVVLLLGGLTAFMSKKIDTVLLALGASQGGLFILGWVWAGSSVSRETGLWMSHQMLVLLLLWLTVSTAAVRTRTDLAELDLRGLARKMPFSVVMFLFAAWSFVGLPPFVGFDGIARLLLGMLAQGNWAAAIVSLLYLLIAVVTLGKWVKRWFGGSAGRVTGSLEAPLPMLLAQILAALALVAMAVYRSRILDLLK